MTVVNSIKKKMETQTIAKARDLKKKKKMEICNLSKYFYSPRHIQRQD